MRPNSCPQKRYTSKSIFFRLKLPISTLETFLFQDPTQAHVQPDRIDKPIYSEINAGTFSYMRKILLNVISYWKYTLIILSYILYLNKWVDYLPSIGAINWSGAVCTREDTNRTVVNNWECWLFYAGILLNLKQVLPVFFFWGAYTITYY